MRCWCGRHSLCCLLDSSPWRRGRQAAKSGNESPVLKREKAQPGTSVSLCQPSQLSFSRRSSCDLELDHMNFIWVPCGWLGSLSSTSFLTAASYEAHKLAAAGSCREATQQVQIQEGWCQPCFPANYRLACVVLFQRTK